MTTSMAAAVFLVLLLATTAHGGFIKSGSIYTIEHKGGRSCGSTEWLGFFNRTCSAGTLNPRTYGPTAGPWLRTFSNPNGDSWRQYIIDVVGQTEDGDDLVSIKSYLEGGKALCEAYITPEKEDRCKGDFWAPIVHTGHRKPYTWRLVPVVGDESYQIIAESRGAGCLKYLGASKSCGIGNVTLFEKDDGSRRQRWVIRESKGAVVPSPPPPAKVRLGAPLINSAYPTGVNSGTATITPPPGATRCVLSHAGTDITFRPTYPSTTININELEPGVEDLLTVVCTSADGVTSPTSNEVLVTPPSPGRLQNTPVVEMINSDDVVATYNITYLPPPGDDCTPVSYKVTYTSADGQKTTITVPAAQPYGTAPTEVQLLNLDLGSSYSVVCVGICQAADVPTTSAPIKVSITTPEVAPPAVPGVLPSPPPPPIASPPPPRVRSPPPKPPLAAPVIEVAYPTGPTTGEVKFTPPADVTNCTVYVNKTPQSIVPAEYPTTTVEITDLIPGNKTFITVTAEADDGRVSGPSNEVPITPPQDQTGPTIDNVVVPGQPDEDFTFTINPPTEGDCNPIQYNITYLPSGGEPRYYLVNATQPYGEAPTIFSTSFIPDTLYTLSVVGICQEGGTIKTTPATDIDIDVSEEDEFGRPIIDSAYSTRIDEAKVLFTPPEGVALCTIFVDGVPVDRVIVKYPTTTASLTGLKPGQQVIISTICESDAGRSTDFSNEIAFTPPTSITAPLIGKVVVPDTPEDPALLKIAPPDSGDCNPVQYNITYQNVGSDLEYLVVDAVEKYGVATTPVFLTNLSADSEYTIKVVGICSPNASREVTPPAEVVIITNGGDNLPDFTVKPEPVEYIPVPEAEPPAPVPVPAPAPVPAPGPGAVPVPAPGPGTIPAPAPVPAPGPGAVPAPAPETVPAPAPETVPVPAPGPGTIPAPAPAPVPAPAPETVPAPAPENVPAPGPGAVPACPAPNVVCPSGTGNAGACVQSSLYCIGTNGVCTSPGGLCQPSSGGTIKVCSKNNNCVSCSGTNPCPLNNPTKGGASSEFQCVSGKSGGCQRRCRTQLDCISFGLKCYSDTFTCDITRAGPVAP